jgi:hypothetical protein
LPDVVKKPAFLVRVSMDWNDVVMNVALKLLQTISVRYDLKLSEVKVHVIQKVDRPMGPRRPALDQYAAQA